MNGRSEASPARTRVDRPDRPGGSGDPGRDAGLDRIGLRLALAAAGPGTKALLPPRPGWPDVVEAAVRIAPGLGVASADWAAACGLLGRRGAAVCLIVTERAAARLPGGRHPPASRPGAYFRALVARARQGRLDLLRSLHGLAAG